MRSSSTRRAGVTSRSQGSGGRCKSQLNVGSLNESIFPLPALDFQREFARPRRRRREAESHSPRLARRARRALRRPPAPCLSGGAVAVTAFAPRFTITNAITAGLTAIERAGGFLEAATLSEEWVGRMSQRALLLEAHHTTHIEGTQLTLSRPSGCGPGNGGRARSGRRARVAELSRAPSTWFPSIYRAASRSPRA